MAKNVGSEKFPTNYNDVYSMVETIARQGVETAKLENELADKDAFYFYDLRESTGQTIEESVIAAATAQAFNKTGAPNFAGKDPKIYTKYFSEWRERQFQTTVRRNDVRRVIAEKGAGIDDMVNGIVNTITQGDKGDDFDERRKLLFNSPVIDFSSINGGKVPKTMRGVLHAAREMYNHVIGKNADLTIPSYESTVKREDVRVAMSSRLLNLVDVNELAHVFNMEKEEFFGQLVVVDASDLPAESLYKIVVYDRKAFGIAEFMYEYSQDVIGEKLYTNHYLTVSRQYFYNSLFKACAIDCTTAATAAGAELYDAATMYTITPTLGGKATLTNPAKTVSKNMAYMTDIIITGAGKVTVNMGGDITATAYDAEKGVIQIPAVTANITITVA